MFEIITEPLLIKEYQKILEQQIRSRLDATCTKSIGFQGGDQSAKVYFNEKDNIWCALKDTAEDWGRYWNPFGIGNPSELKQLSITVEINIPLGLDRRVGGVFLTDDYGNVYLGHRGKIGGGKTNIGKSLFFEKYTGRIVDATDGKKQNKIAVISALCDVNLILNIKRFVYDVQKIKTPEKADELVFNFENDIRKEYGLSLKINPTMEHAEVVNAFARKLEAVGKVPFNTREIDIYTIDDNGDYELVFEMKSKTDSQSIYTGIGQLFFHTAKYANAQKFLVLPEEVSIKYVDVIKKLGVGLILYKIENDEIVFTPYETTDGAERG